MVQRSVLRRERQSHGAPQLGEIKQIYRGSLHTAAVLGFFAALILIADSIVLAVTFPRVLESLPSGGDAVSVIFILSLTFLIVPVFMILATIAIWRRDRHTITLYEQGIVERRGRNVQAMHWRDISYLWHHVTPGPVVNGQQGPPEDSYEIQGAEGLNIRFASEIINAHELFRKVTQQATPYLLSQTRESFQSGLDISFGSLAATPAGLALQQANQAPRLLPWNELESTQIGSKGQTIIKQKGNRYTWFEGEIPNTEVFHRFVKELQEPAEN